MAPTEKVITCQLCGFSREVQGPADEKGGCPFCGAGPSGQTVSSERPDTSGVQVGRQGEPW